MVSEPRSPTHFGAVRAAWVFSRYADVQAALREPQLHPEGASSSAVPRAHVAKLTSSFDFERWLEGATSIGSLLEAALAKKSPVDLLRTVIRPWCVSLSAAVLHVDRKTASRLGALAPYLAGSAEDGFRVRRKLADAAAARILNLMHVPGAKATFLGITQTLLNFIANAWIFILEHPEMSASLHEQPDTVLRMLEELLRCSGPVHTLVRKASVPVNVAGTQIDAGQCVILKIADANRDPDQFPAEHALEGHDRSAGHLALGAGPHACPGALLVRAASLSALRDFAKYADQVELAKPVRWRNGATLRTPLTFIVRRSH